HFSDDPQREAIGHGDKRNVRLQPLPCVARHGWQRLEPSLYGLFTLTWTRIPRIARERVPSPTEASRLFAKRTLHHDQFTNVLGGEQSNELTGVIHDRQGRHSRSPAHHKRTIKTHLRNERGKPGTHYVRHRRVRT